MAVSGWVAIQAAAKEATISEATSVPVLAGLADNNFYIMKLKYKTSLVFLVLALVSAGCGNETINVNKGGSSSYQASENKKTISRQEAVNEYWDEIKENVDGTETVEACSNESGSCYDLDADVSNGTIETIHFTNGGHLDFSADIDNDGSASDSDVNGNNWDFTLDMDSSIVDDAIENWAGNNGYAIE